MCVDHLESVFHFLYFSLPLAFIFRDLQDTWGYPKTWDNMHLKYCNLGQFETIETLIFIRS